MLSSKVFVSGNSQAVRLPKEYQVEDKELYVQKIGKALVFIPKNDPWDVFERSLDQFSDDFFADGRNQPAIQDRNAL